MNANSYSLSGYGSMIADGIRLESYHRAMSSVIRPGTVVMDIGTGPGVMAVLACQLGASRVFAIEGTEVIQVAREIAAANGFADRIEFFEDMSTKVTVPVRADVIVSDLRGVMPLFEHHIPSIVDARNRFLVPGGTMIARKDTIWAAVAEAPAEYSRIIDPWDRNPVEQNLSPAKRRLLNEFRKARLKPEQLLTIPRKFAELDYRTIENPNVAATLRWTVDRSGTGHGFLVWFDMDLADGIGFSNGPESPELVYGAAFFPWPEPVTLAAGQTVCVELQANLLESDYFWRWTTHIESMEQPGTPTARFVQSQLQGAVLSPQRLHKSAANHVPKLSLDGEIRRRTLQLMDGKSSLEEIAQRLATDFHERFTRWQQALTYAGAISQDFSV